MIRITRYLYIHFLIVPMLILAFVLKSQMTFFISFGVVMIHETAHLIAALMLNVDVKSIEILPFGMTLRLDSFLVRTPKKEILIALSGPLSNVVMLVLSEVFVIKHGANLNLLIFIVVNWSVLLLNLFPIPPLDGGRVMRALVIKHAGIMASAKIVKKISCVFLAIIWSIGIFLVIHTKGNPSLCIIGAFLFFSLFEEKKFSDLLIAQEIIYEKEKFKKLNMIPTRTISVRKSTPAMKIIKKLNYSNFFVIYIVNDNMEIINVATERDFLRAVKKYGYRAQAKDVLINPQEYERQKQKFIPTTCHIKTEQKS